MSLWTWVAVAFLLLVAFQWSRTWNLYGGWRPSLMRLMLRNAMRTVQRAFFVVSCCGLAAAAILVVAPGSLPPLPPELVLAVSLVGLTRSLLPPAVLVLGASTPTTGALVAELHSAVSLMRVVHLLEPMSAHPGPFMVEEIRTTSDRTEAWLHHVEELMAFVPVIVIDVRHFTNAVRREVEVAERKHLAKSLFLRSNDTKGLIEMVSARLRR